MSCRTDVPNQTVIVGDASLSLSNGKLFYNEKPLTGNLKGYYQNGELKSDVKYLNGKKEGVEEVYYNNGVLQTHRIYSKGVKIDVHRGWWPDGSSKFEYHFDKEGRYDGTVKEWYTNGQLLRDFNYTSGKEAGRQQMFRSNGAIRANYEVINGERFGLIGLKKCYTIKKDSIKIY